MEGWLSGWLGDDSASYSYKCSCDLDRRQPCFSISFYRKMGPNSCPTPSLSHKPRGNHSVENLAKGNLCTPRGIFSSLNYQQHIKMGLVEASKKELTPIPGQIWT